MKCTKIEVLVRTLQMRYGLSAFSSNSVLLALSLNAPNVPNFITKFKQSQIFCPGLKGFLWKKPSQATI